jgi:diglucosylglycerate octanoyltransferase
VTPAATFRLVVIGDSFAFTDHEGPQLPDAPHLYPNVVAGRLEGRLGRPVSLTVLARPGWGVRGVWSALTKDRHVQFEVLGTADAVVVAVGSHDHVPTGHPEALTLLLPYVRPDRLRRWLRRTIHRTHPHVVRVTRGRLARTPESEFVRLFDRCLLQIRGLTRGAPTVVLGPAGQASTHYGGRNPHLARRRVLQRDIAADHGIPTVEPVPLVRAASAELNPDGIHWPPDTHAAIGAALADPLVAQLTGAAPTPPSPWVGIDDP